MSVNRFCRSLKESDWAISDRRDSLLGINLRETQWKTVNNIQKIQGWELAHWFFEQIAHFFVSERAKERMSDLRVKKSELLPPLYCHEQWEWIAHGCSFVICDGSDSLTVALLSRAIRVNSSYRSLKKSNWAKRDGSNLLLGIKRGNIVKNCQKQTKNIIFFEQIACFWERFAWITNESLTQFCFFFNNHSTLLWLSYSTAETHGMPLWDG